MLLTFPAELVWSGLVCNRVKESILVSIRVTLRIHCLSNQVHIEHGLITIVKWNVYSCVSRMGLA